MANSEHEGYAFVVLLDDEDDALGLSRLLDDVKLPEASVPSTFLSPPTRGKDFFADESKQDNLNDWWASNVPRNAVPVFLLEHTDGLQDYIEGLDGTFYIGVTNSDDAVIYQQFTEIKTFIAHGPLDFATIIMREFSGGNGSGDIIFDQGEAIRMAALSADFPIDFDDADFFPEEQEAGFTPPLQQTQLPPGFIDPSTFGGALPTFPGMNPAAQYGQPPPVASSQPTPRPQQSGPKEVPVATSPHPFDLLANAGSTTPPMATGPPPQQAIPPYVPSPQQQPQQYQVPPVQPSRPGSPPQQPEWSPNNPLIPPSALNPNAGSPFDTDSSLSNFTPGGGNWDPGAPSSFAGLPTAPPPPQWQAKPQNPNAGQGGQGYPPVPNQPTYGQDPLQVPQTPPAAKKKSFAMPGFLSSKKQTKSGYQTASNADLASWMVSRGPTIVVMGSRKGGVGKTSFAAGVAIVAGTVLDSVGHKAAIVDANIANPDAWGQLNLQVGAATVRETIAALTANRQPPPPVFATTPALACYPEDRETAEYSKTDIRRLADYLKRRYTFIVVDMSNRLPDPMAGPEAAVAAYWLELADVLVLPTTSARNDFNGVLDYLDIRDLPPTVVPYIKSNARKNNEHPATQQYLSTIRSRVQAIVEVPDEADTVRLAGMEGIPVEQISPGLRQAYRELTEIVVRSPARMGRR